MMKFVLQFTRFHISFSFRYFKNPKRYCIFCKNLAVPKAQILFRGNYVKRHNDMIEKTSQYDVIKIVFKYLYITNNCVISKC